MDLIGAHLVLACQRTGCGAVESVDLGTFDVGDAVRVEQDEWPDGWGWDVNGNDQVLHCDEHRAAG